MKEVVEALEEMMDADLTLAAPCLEAIVAIVGLQPPAAGGQHQGKAAPPSAQLLQRCVCSMASRLGAVELHDLGPVLRFCLLACSKSSAKEVAGAVRASLFLVNATDPRLQVPDESAAGGGAKQS